MMEEIVLMLTAASPESEILKRLADAMADYTNDKSEVNKKKLSLVCMMFIAKERVGDSFDGAMDAIKRFKELEARDEMHTPSQH